jgi:hypothetical protein
MVRIRPKNWWQAGLLWGTGMFLYYVIKHAVAGELTLAYVGKAFLMWEAGGLVFGIALTGVLSLFSHKNLFRGFPDKKGER